jgi:hypothetical protein
MSALGFGAASSSKIDNLAVTSSSSPYISVYPFNKGFGSKISSPSSLPGSGSENRVKFSPSNSSIAISGIGSVGSVSIYRWNPVTGFGAKYTSPSTTITLKDIGFNNGENLVYICGYAAPFISVYPWDKDTGFGTKYADSSFSSGGTNDAITRACFNPAGTFIAFGNRYASAVQAFAWSNTSGFGSRYTGSFAFSAELSDLTFSSDGAVVYCTMSGTPYLYRFAFSSSGFGARGNYSSPTSLGALNGLAINPAGTKIVLARQTTPYVSSLNLPFASLASPSALAGAGRGVDFDRLGKNIAIAHNISPSVTVYSWTDSSTFITKYANPVSLPAGNGYSVSFSN